MYKILKQSVFMIGISIINYFDACGSEMQDFLEQTAVQRDVNLFETSLVQNLELERVIEETPADMALENEIEVVPEEITYEKKRQKLRDHYKTTFLANFVGDNSCEAYDALIEAIKSIENEVMCVYQTKYNAANSQNVHVFDPTVSTRLPDIIMIARTLGLGQDLSCTEAIQLAQTIESFPTHYAVKGGEKRDCLTPVCSGFDAQNSEMFSRSITLAIDMYKNFNGYETGMTLLNGNRDNWELSGGCFQGRRNRVFLAFLGMMDFLTQP